VICHVCWLIGLFVAVFISVFDRSLSAFIIAQSD